MIYFVEYSDTDPVLEWDTICHFWILKEPIRVQFKNEEHEDKSFTVPAGFQTDLASIPRAFRSFIPQVGGYNLAAIIHDYCYRDPSMRWMDKEEADMLFRIGMEQAGVGRFRRTVIYRAVSWFGGASYQPTPPTDD